MTRAKPTPVEVGARIVALREQLGLSTAELAASADVFSPVSEERVLSIEAGAEAPAEALVVRRFDPDNPF